MQASKPSSVIITDRDRKTIVGQCLATIDRDFFLKLWRSAWEIITESMLANAAASQGDKWKAVAYLFDNNLDFKFLCWQMLRLFDVNIDRLDIGQVSELLFFSEGGQGLLLDVQFSAMPLGGEAPKEDDWIDPAARLLALIAFRSGNWAEAYEALKNIPHNLLVQAFEAERQAHEEQTRKAKNPGRSSPPPRSNQSQSQSEDPRLAMVELVRQKAEQMRQQGAAVASQNLMQDNINQVVNNMNQVVQNT